MNLIPKKVFLTKGIGKDKTKLQSFECALRDAGISAYNLVEVSSILPPHCEEVSKEEGIKEFQPGQIVFLVLARNTSKEKDRKMVASVGVAKPKDNTQYGYLSEHHGFDQDSKSASKFSEDLAASMLASTLGITFDQNADYDEKQKIFHLSDKIVETKSITSATTIDSDELYTTVVAAAVFIL